MEWKLTRCKNGNLPQPTGAHPQDHFIYPANGVANGKQQWPSQVPARGQPAGLGALEQCYLEKRKRKKSSEEVGGRERAGKTEKS